MVQSLKETDPSWSAQLRREPSGHIVAPADGSSRRWRSAMREASMEEYDAYNLEETKRRLEEEREEFEQLVDDAQTS